MTGERAVALRLGTFGSRAFFYVPGVVAAGPLNLPPACKTFQAALNFPTLEGPGEDGQEGGRSESERYVQILNKADHGLSSPAMFTDAIL